jgi:hypothetical protein
MTTPNLSLVEACQVPGDVSEQAAQSGTVRHQDASGPQTPVTERTVSEHRVIVSVVQPAYLEQRAAAAYLSVSIRYFRDFVNVRPRELPGYGRKPVLRWAVADLDAWMARVSETKNRDQRAS